MNGQYTFTPQIWPSILMVILMITLFLFSGRRRRVPGATVLMITSLFATAYAAGSLLETASLDVATKIFWYKFQSHNAASAHDSPFANREAAKYRRSRTNGSAALHKSGNHIPNRPPSAIFRPRPSVAENGR